MIYSTTTKILEQWFVIVNMNRGLEDNQEMFSSKFKALTIRILKGIGDNWDYKFKVFLKKILSLFKYFMFLSFYIWLINLLLIFCNIFFSFFLFYIFFRKKYYVLFFIFLIFIFLHVIYLYCYFCFCFCFCFFCNFFIYNFFINILYKN
jgi:hypothetical protein